MTQRKAVKDIMVDVFSFPHIPYWFSIKQSIGIIKVSLSSKKYPEPMAILVFDEKYNLLGTLGLKDILKGLEPNFLKPASKSQLPGPDESGLSVLWDTLFNKESKEAAERSVSDVMVPAKFFVEPDDPLTKAAYLMVRHDLAVLPVLEGKKKFIGLVRMVEIFDELSGAILTP